MEQEVKQNPEKKQLPMIAHVFFGGCSLIGLYIVYRLLEKSHQK